MKAIKIRGFKIPKTHRAEAEIANAWIDAAQARIDKVGARPAKIWVSDVRVDSVGLIVKCSLVWSDNNEPIADYQARNFELTRPLDAWQCQIDGDKIGIRKIGADNGP